MSEPKQSRAQQFLGDFGPKMVSLTDDVLFGDIWERAANARVASATARNP